MNISSQIFPTDRLDCSYHVMFNVTEVTVVFASVSLVQIITILLGFLINSYVIWLIVTGAGNGLAAEIFGLNLAVCEILFCMECLLALLIYKCTVLWIVVIFLDGFAVTARPLFQSLICVERYLAVVHPVTFLKYKPLRYRVICSVIVWVAGFVSCGVSIMTLAFIFSEIYFSFVIAQLLPFLSIQLFCLVTVLRALKQSGPGERKREEENQMKKRAFYFNLITTVSMIILYVPYIILIVPQWISVDSVKTLGSLSTVCFTLAGLVQPLFFLYRVGKISFMKCQ